MRHSLYDRYVHDLSRAWLKASDSVLDVGCGDGTKTAILSRYARQVIGADLENRLKPGSAVPFRRVTPGCYGQRDEFDVVTSFDVIEHIDDDRNFVAELIRVTRPGGVMIIGTPNRRRLSNRVIGLIRGEILYPYYLGYDYVSGGDIIHVREYTTDDLRELGAYFNQASVCDVYSAFFGLYTPFGAIGLTGLKQTFLAPFAQHLFLILKKQ